MLTHTKEEGRRENGEGIKETKSIIFFKILV